MFRIGMTFATTLLRLLWKGVRAARARKAGKSVVVGFRKLRFGVVNMDIHSVLAVALIGSVCGMALYCLASALAVWRSRNKKHGGRKTKEHWVSRNVKRAGVYSLLAGIACMVLTVAVELALSSRGLLHGEDLFTVRPPEDLFVEWTTPEKSAQAGEVIARFGSPEHSAEIEVVKLELDVLRAQKAVLSKQPLEPDAEITRELLDTAGNRRHLQSSLNDLKIEKLCVERSLSQQHLTKKQEIDGLAVTLAQLKQELGQAVSSLDFNTSQLKRSDELLQARAASQMEHEQWSRDTKVARDEVDKLQEQITNTASQKTNLETGLVEFTRIMEAQSASYREQIDDSSSRLEAEISREKSLSQRLKADLVRAAELRERELEQIDVQIRQSEGKLKGLLETQQMTAPFSGEFVYRDPSPRMAEKEEPLLVLGRSQGLHLRLRVPVWHKSAMERGAAVKLELASAMNEDENSERHFVERRFTGTLVGWQELPEDNWYCLAELACTPPAEAVEYLASGGEVLAHPRWWPWLCGSPGFQLGLILIALGVAAWSATAAVAVGKKARAGRDELAKPEAKQEEHLFAEYAGDGAMLHLLGTQLHDAASRRHIDRHLIVAAEWALDRHRARAVRLISAGLHENNGIGENLQRLVEETRAKQPEGTNGSGSQGDLRRFLQVMQVVADDGLEVEIKRLLRELDGHDLDGHDFNSEVRLPPSRNFSLPK